MCIRDRSAACFLHGHGGAELRGTAHQLAQGLAGEGAASRHGLWMQAQSLLLVGLFLEMCIRDRRWPLSTAKTTRAAGFFGSTGERTQA